MRVFNITVLMRAGGGAILLLALAACGTIRARLDALPTTRVTTVPADLACDAPEENEKRLTGAYLRQSDASGLTFVPVLVRGRENLNGLTQEVTVNDQSQTREVEDIRGTTFEGSKDAIAKARNGFGPKDVLPNVYDVTYEAKDITFSGPMVLGPGSFNFEIPTSGATLYSGRITIDLITQSEDGAQQQVRANGRFALQAGFGSGRGVLTASGFGPALPFDTLQWTNLYLCGTRFVSSGKGIVTVQKEGGPPLPPFKQGREPAAFNALFQSVQFAPRERPAPPVSLGGVFVIQSDNGTMTAVFLSDQKEVPDADA
jgi:hypothetical protein